MELRKHRGLSANALKLLAAVAMVVDHVGFFWFPMVLPLRYVGRLAFPIFAFMIAEGCEHTRSRLRYFLQVLVLGLVCQAAIWFATIETALCVPLSFALGILPVYCLQSHRRAVRENRNGAAALWLAGIVLLMLLMCLLQWTVRIDYGVWGCLLPLSASLLNNHRYDSQSRLLRLLPVTVCLAVMTWEMTAWQAWSLLTIPLLYLYCGERGKWKLKYFFYIFYPAHLLLLQLPLFL